MLYRSLHSAYSILSQALDFSRPEIITLHPSVKASDLEVKLGLHSSRVKNEVSGQTDGKDVGSSVS